MNHLLAGRRIVVGVGGGIAAFKACELIRELRRQNAQVRVAMTAAAEQFVTPLTLQSLSGEPVLTNYFDVGQEAGFGHLDLARWAELFVIAPATADLIARIRAGMANDPVTTSFLAFRGPVLLAPAMNVAMWENRQTQENVASLKKDERFQWVGPGVGLLADGDVGPGRLAEIHEIVSAAARCFSGGPLSGKRVLVTAGPTREFIDPVRFISNPSTGKMGLALAHEARKLGATVTVVLGPVGDSNLTGLNVLPVVSADEMASAVISRLGDMDFLIATAAVSDFKAKDRSVQKTKKTEIASSWEMVRTRDILQEASAVAQSMAQRPTLVGFAAETENLLQHAREKLEKKKLDLIVANDVSEPGVGFGSDRNRVTLVWNSKDSVSFEGSKPEVAAFIWKSILER